MDQSYAGDSGSKFATSTSLDKQVILMNQLIADLNHLQNNWDKLIEEARLVSTAMNIELSLIANGGRPVRMVRSTNNKLQKRLSCYWWLWV